MISYRSGPDSGFFVRGSNSGIFMPTDSARSFTAST